jgi:hypothetical protein
MTSTDATFDATDSTDLDDHELNLFVTEREREKRRRRSGSI